MVFCIMLLVVYLFAGARVVIHAQRLTPQKTPEIPSDLSLDLALAKKNPSPQQRAILASQVSLAVITTTSGETLALTPANSSPLQVQTESAQDVINPEQTTSEQVTTSLVPVDETSPTDQNVNRTDTNMIPETSVLKPDDNAVVPSVPPENSPVTTEGQPTTNTSQTDSQERANTSGAAGTIPQQTESIPLENGNPNPPPQDQPSQDTSPSNDSSSVQGVSTGPHISWWQRIVNLFFGRE